MNEERREHRRTPIARPTEEDTAEQTTQEAGGLHQDLRGVRPGPGPELARQDEADDVLNRSAEERYDTPRRYENEEGEPALPANDATLKTKI
jgi:hypothetical protein